MSFFESQDGRYLRGGGAVLRVLFTGDGRISVSCRGCGFFLAGGDGRRGAAVIHRASGYMEWTVSKTRFETHR